MTTECDIQTLVDLETDAWNRKDAEALVSLFHPDMTKAHERQAGIVGQWMIRIRCRHAVTEIDFRRIQWPIRHDR